MKDETLVKQLLEGEEDFIRPAPPETSAERTPEEEEYILHIASTDAHHYFQVPKSILVELKRRIQADACDTHIQGDTWNWFASFIATKDKPQNLVKSGTVNMNLEICWLGEDDILESVSEWDI